MCVSSKKKTGMEASILCDIVTHSSRHFLADSHTVNLNPQKRVFCFFFFFFPHFRDLSVIRSSPGSAGQRLQRAASKELSAGDVAEMEMKV